VSTVKVAAIQSAFADNREANVQAMSEMVVRAASEDAKIILLPELFEGHYFPQQQLEEDLDRALPTEGHPTLGHFQELAQKLEVVLPVSFFERDRQSLYNSMALIDADGALRGIYRKSHIPDGPGYQEKFFRYATIGVGICWDQWFPEAARVMVLQGADLLFYPTAIGSEPHDPTLDTRLPWQRVMQGHAVANACPVVAANRVGTEGEQRFYGSSFICNQRGDMLAEANQSETTIISAEINLDQVRQYRDAFGFFRDRRPSLYTPITEE
jgi:N-carbamoylputrescine amidase